MTAAALSLATADWTYVWQNLGTLLRGVWPAVRLTGTALLAGFLVGVPLGALEVYGGRRSAWLARKAGVAVRGTPILVIMFITYFGLGLSPAFVAATAALGVRSAAYQAQVFRGALQSIDRGQMEAARAVGLSKLGAIRHVMIPQGLRRFVPGFQNEYTIVLKDTSIAFAISYTEIFYQMYNLIPQQTTATPELFVTAAAVYLALTLVGNRVLDYVDDAFGVPDGGASQ
ncbi:amino acid ABC transporter permease [Halarchaeum nitratireducens]|uniref:Glutamine ABC transporter permease n=1 Tax=Halarchaeum nitratireducens TaxID=489913 RepID=A0A830G815_9EURY|nr:MULTISPECIES: amino acid ABC transporter permease [Halarchaeum]MBP2251390.1 polar amino acid transport system permease protein [Halarchaeum solikamskense]GGN07594.1 glutamine ABC transporter permease [Halarchaeum nitratireducens]